MEARDHEGVSEKTKLHVLACNSGVGVARLTIEAKLLAHLGMDFLQTSVLHEQFQSLRLISR